MKRILLFSIFLSSFVNVINAEHIIDPVRTDIYRLENYNNYNLRNYRIIFTFSQRNNFLYWDLMFRILPSYALDINEAYLLDYFYSLPMELDPKDESYLELKAYDRFGFEMTREIICCLAYELVDNMYMMGIGLDNCKVYEFNPNNGSYQLLCSPCTNSSGSFIWN